jgi:glutathione S-transferase
MNRLEKSRAHRILWLLEELGVDYELKTYKRGSDMLAPKELKDVHPLGKSPIITVQATEATEPLVIAESAVIVEYLTEHFGPSLIPARYTSGKEGLVGGESEEWIRYRYFMHYAEGSLMPLLVIGLVFGRKNPRWLRSNSVNYSSEIKGPAVPFFIRPISKAIAGKVEEAFLAPNLKTHFEFLEDQIASSPENGQFLCGPKLTGADIIMIFPLEAAHGRAGLTADKYPKLSAYIERLHKREAYQRAIKKVEETTGETFDMALG